MGVVAANMARITNALHDRGVRRTAQSFLDVATDAWFERRYRVDTSGTIALDQLSIDSQDWDPGGRYQPIRIGHLRRLLARVPVGQRTGFVDFGAGKGRALFVASLCGFPRAVGVEFAFELCVAAERNLRAFETSIGRHSGVEIVHEDAARYQVEPDQNVFYFYSPFGPEPLKLVVDNIQESLRQTPRPAWILYSNAKARRVIDQNDAFLEVFTETWGGIETVAYAAAERPHEASVQLEPLRGQSQAVGPGYA